LSAVSAVGSEVIAASLDRQFHDSADFTDHNAASLDSTVGLFKIAAAFPVRNVYSLS